MKYEIQIEDLPPEYRQIAEAIGIEPALALVEIRGGEGVYVPKGDSISRAARDRTIRAEFNGANYRDLARSHGLTESWVRAIVHQATRQGSLAGIDVVDNQLALF